MAKKKGGRKGGPKGPAKVQAPSAKPEPQKKPTEPTAAAKPAAAPEATPEKAGAPAPAKTSTPEKKAAPEKTPEKKAAPAPVTKKAAAPPPEDDEDDADAKDARASTPPPSHDAPSAGAAWAQPFVALERGWTWFEVRLLLVVILSLIAAMVAWISLKGLSIPLEGQSAAGMMFRVLAGAILGGAIAQQVQKRAKLDPRNGALAVLGAAIVCASAAPLWRAAGVDYFGRMLNWLQEGSSLTMFGGLRGVSTRLTIVLAMIGASLAAASGKHINIDAILRFLNPKLRVFTFVLSTIATMTVCIAAAWGFTDYISIESFAADKDATRGEKIAHVGHHVSQDLFLWRKQVGFDLEALPKVLGGGRWDDETRMNGRQWNVFLETSGYRDYFEKDEVDALISPPDDLDSPRLPQVVVPNGSARGLFTHVLNLVFPIGLLIIALRLFLRMILVVSGHASVEVEGELLHGPAAERPVAKPDEVHLSELGEPEPDEPKKKPNDDDDDGQVA